MELNLRPFAYYVDILSNELPRLLYDLSQSLIAGRHYTAHESFTHIHGPYHGINFTYIFFITIFVGFDKIDKKICKREFKGKLMH